MKDVVYQKLKALLKGYREIREFYLEHIHSNSSFYIKQPHIISEYIAVLDKKIKGLEAISKANVLDNLHLLNEEYIYMLGWTKMLDEEMVESNTTGEMW